MWKGEWERVSEVSVRRVVDHYQEKESVSECVSECVSVWVSVDCVRVL